MTRILGNAMHRLHVIESDSLKESQVKDEILITVWRMLTINFSVTARQVSFSKR